jgi:hypothetical protein
MTWLITLKCRLMRLIGLGMRLKQVKTRTPARTLRTLTRIAASRERIATAAESRAAEVRRIRTAAAELAENRLKTGGYLTYTPTPGPDVVIAG